MTEREIWDFLMEHMDNAYGAAGMMGNLYAESALRANDLEGRAAKRLGMTDAEYTAAVDDGSYPYDRFTGDRAGYGLAQWTYPARKAQLYKWAKNAHTSIGDARMQLGFLMHELENSYRGVLAILRDAGSVEEASCAVLIGYEKPANQGASVQEKRAKYSQQFYNKYAIKGADKMAKIPCKSLIGDFQEMYSQGWGYIPNTSGEVWTEEKQKKSTNSTVQKYGAQWIGHNVADCSGAFVNAYKRHGASIYHGSNRIAREYVIELRPVSEARPGMAAFKIRKPGEQGCALPDEYKKGGPNHNGDLNDYYHIGLVDANPEYVLNSQGTRTGFVRSSIKDNWQYVACLKNVEYSEEADPADAALYFARVQADNGQPVNLRKSPSLSAARVCKVNVGTTVAVLNIIDALWVEITFGAKRGYMMAKYLYAMTPVEAAPDPAPDPAPVNPLDAARQWLEQAAEHNRLGREAIEAAQAMLDQAAQDRG